MSAAILSIADRQSRDVQRRAIKAVNLQREQLREHVAQIRANGFAPEVERRELPASLDAWYHAQPIPAGRIAPKLALSADAKRCYGLPASARLVDLRGFGAEVDQRCVVMLSTVGGYVVGVKTPDAGGVGIMWRSADKAAFYAMRLEVEHGLPRLERVA